MTTKYLWHTLLIMVNEPYNTQEYSSQTNINLDHTTNRILYFKEIIIVSIHCNKKLHIASKTSCNMLFVLGTHICSNEVETEVIENNLICKINLIYFF